MTTAKKVKAQLSEERAINDKRAHEGSQSKEPLARLTPEMETREEYQRMYVANAEQQAVQERQDLNQRLKDIKEDDARHMKMLTDDIQEKRKVLLGDIKKVHQLSDMYARDHELGENLGEGDGVTSKASKESSIEAKDIQTQTAVITQSQSISNTLRSALNRDDSMLLKSAR